MLPVGVTWERVTELFSAALDYPPTERETFLTTACGDNAALMTEVRSLLRSLGLAGDFLEPGTAVGPPLSPSLLAELDRAPLFAQFPPETLIGHPYRVRVQTMVNPGVDQRITVTEQGTMAPPEAASPVPAHYALYANVPNPFNPVTTIRFDLPSAGTVRLTVFDATGRVVRKLLDATRYEAGQQHVTWDGRSERGVPMASGIYFYQIVANDFRATKRMTLLK